MASKLRTATALFRCLDPLPGFQAGPTHAHSHVNCRPQVDHMRRISWLIWTMAISTLSPIVSAQRIYLGFDKNDYPGDSAMLKLRDSYRYTSYWLNNPPGLDHNPWKGKRAFLKKQGFGFLVLFNGKLSTELRGKDAVALGRQDGNTAVDTAIREGFPNSVRIFLDQEQGGRLLPDQSAYLMAWVQAVRGRGARAGVYCSGIDVPDGSGRINTAENIQSIEAEKSKLAKAPAPKLALWVANDQCPPAPGCTPTKLPPAVGARLKDPGQIAVWQYAQSPRRAQFSASCPKNAAPDGNCYAPGLPNSPSSFIDLDVANSPDPSQEP